MVHVVCDVQCDVCSVLRSSAVCTVQCKSGVWHVCMCDVVKSMCMVQIQLCTPVKSVKCALYCGRLVAS